MRMTAAMDPCDRFELSERHLALLPTPADVTAYRERGFWVSPEPLFDVDELDRAVRGQDEFYAGRRDAAAMSPGVESLCWQPGQGGLRKNDYASLQKWELADIVRKPILAAVAARLSGVDAVRLWHDQLLYKPPRESPGAGNVGWHTDRGYWLTCSSEAMITAWVAFEDVDETMGPVIMIEGSHQWPDNSYGLSFFEQDLLSGERQFRTGGAPVNRVPMILRRGQVSFHGVRTVHGSSDNLSGQPRRGMAVHMQPASNRFVEHLMPDGTPAWHINDFLARSLEGRPDYADPELFPLLWSSRPEDTRSPWPRLPARTRETPCVS